MAISVGSFVSDMNLDLGLDIKTAVKGKYDEFIDVLLTMGKAMENPEEEFVFPMFPNSPVTASDPSFNMFAQYTMNHLEQQIEHLLKAEQFKGEIDKKAQQLFG